MSILNWFKEHKPEVLENTQWIFECKDYIRFRLTGEAFAEKTDYSGSGLMNLRDRCFDEELLALFGLKDLMRCLPPLKNATDVCGAVCKETAERTGLRKAPRFPAACSISTPAPWPWMLPMRKTCALSRAPGALTSFCLKPRCWTARL